MSDKARKVEQAAQNNASWIDTVCKAHGCSTETRRAAWLSFDPTPPFHPNMDTLGGPELGLDHRQIIEELLQAGIPGSFAVKDSYQALDLCDLGFKVLFDSQWIYKDVSTLGDNRVSHVEWEEIRTASSLVEWEKAWAGDVIVQNIFLPALLENRDVLFVAARQGGRIVAGGIANVGADCVGVSNIFLPAEDTNVYRHSFIEKIHHSYPHLPVVGYETGADLQGMQQLGFEAIGNLRVWYYERVDGVA